MKPDNRDDQRNKPQSGTDRPQRKDDPRTGGRGSDVDKKRGDPNTPASGGERKSPNQQNR